MHIIAHRAIARQGTGVFFHHLTSMATWCAMRCIRQNSESHGIYYLYDWAVLFAEFVARSGDVEVDVCIPGNAVFFQACTDTVRYSVLYDKVT